MLASTVMKGMVFKREVEGRERERERERGGGGGGRREGGGKEGEGEGETEGGWPDLLIFHIFEQ